MCEKEAWKQKFLLAAFPSAPLGSFGRCCLFKDACTYLDKKECLRHPVPEGDQGSSCDPCHVLGVLYFTNLQTVSVLRLRFNFKSRVQVFHRGHSEQVVVFVRRILMQILVEDAQGPCELRKGGLQSGRGNVGQMKNFSFRNP